MMTHDPEFAFLKRWLDEPNASLGDLKTHVDEAISKYDFSILSAIIDVLHLAIIPASEDDPARQEAALLLIEHILLWPPASTHKAGVMLWSSVIPWRDDSVVHERMCELARTQEREMSGVTLLYLKEYL